MPRTSSRHYWGTEKISVGQEELAQPEPFLLRGKLSARFCSKSTFALLRRQFRADQADAVKPAYYKASSGSE
jgi:hypothetical protein